MTDKSTFDVIRDRINTATNGIAARIRALKEAVLNPDGLNAGEELKLSEEFDAIADQLEAIAAEKDTPAEPAPEA